MLETYYSVPEVQKPLKVTMTSVLQDQTYRKGNIEYNNVENPNIQEDQIWLFHIEAWNWDKQKILRCI